MNIIDKLDSYLNESAKGMVTGLKKAIDDFGLPEQGTKVYKFWQGPDNMWWVIIVEFKNKYYGIDQYGEMWEGNIKQIIDKIKTSTGVDFSGSKPKIIR